MYSIINIRVKTVTRKHLITICCLSHITKNKLFTMFNRITLFVDINTNN